MPPPEKRLPGQSNAEYEGRQNPNAKFLGTQSLSGGGDPSFIVRISQAVFAWITRRGRKSR
ncbi:hypothetical protein [Spirillospora sp. NPDC029432]|uniref:hypothetical protein n=1 Tax=Spirillospora sp. NPDC029432 TaxID=3154599 RepID=UPI0034533AFA